MRIFATLLSVALLSIPGASLFAQDMMMAGTGFYVAAGGGVATRALTNRVVIPSRCMDSEPGLTDHGSSHFAACHFPLEQDGVAAQDTPPFVTGQSRRHS